MRYSRKHSLKHSLKDSAPTLRRATRLALAAAVFLALAAQAGETPDDGVYKDHIDWGVMMDMSGPASASQSVWARGFETYMKKVNDAGGINGRKVNVLLEDDRFDMAQFRINFDKLSGQTPVLGISGMGNSSGQVALLPSIKRGKVPVLGTYVTAKPAIEPPLPQYYAGFCGFREMAMVGVGTFSDKLGLKAPKIATVHLDTASGKEYVAFVDEAVAKRGGTNTTIPIKVTASDATPQVLEIMKIKPDLIAIHGVVPTAVLLMRALKQYGVSTPAFAISYLGTPGVYNALGPEVGANYNFVSCFTPASADDTAGTREMSAAADKYGFGPMKDDINFVAGWSIGQLAAEAISKAGPEPTREKLIELLSKGFEVDTRGASAPLKYTPENHQGPVQLRAYTYDYTSKRFKAQGSYADSVKYVK